MTITSNEYYATHKYVPYWWAAAGGDGVRKPADMFDRDREWSALVGFARSGQNGATLGIVSGRRRQGKTFLLEALCREAGGCYFSAEDAAQAESLRYLGISLGSFHGSPGPIHLPDWRAAVDALLYLGRDREIPVVLDE